MLLRSKKSNNKILSFSECNNRDSVPEMSQKLKLEFVEVINNLQKEPSTIT
jgi:hypothetical protein